MVVGGEVLASNVGYELLVGYTRSGNLLGLLDGEEILEAKTHLVRVGRGGGWVLDQDWRCIASGHFWCRL